MKFQEILPALHAQQDPPDNRNFVPALAVHRYFGVTAHGNEVVAEVIIDLDNHRNQPLWHFHGLEIHHGPAGVQLTLGQHGEHVLHMAFENSSRYADKEDLCLVAHLDVLHGLLTETGNNTGIFTGTVPVSETPGPGVVTVTEGDTLTAGVEFRQQGGERLSKPGGEWDKSEFALFFHNEYSPVEKLTLTLGTRLNVDEVSGSELCPELGLVLRPRDGTILRGAINKGFRRATGEIIAWLNFDDTYLPGAVKEAGGHLANHSDVAKRG